MIRITLCIHISKAWYFFFFYDQRFSLTMIQSHILLFNSIQNLFGKYHERVWISCIQIGVLVNRLPETINFHLFNAEVWRKHTLCSWIASLAPVRFANISYTQWTLSCIVCQSFVLVCVYEQAVLSILIRTDKPPVTYIHYINKHFLYVAEIVLYKI